MKKLLSSLLAMALILSIAAIPTLAAGTYYLKGIQDGERILLNEDLSRLVYISTSAYTSQSQTTAADGISKVVFKSGDEVLFEDTEAPFEYLLKFDKISTENNITAVIYGADDAELQTISCTYTTLLAKDGVREDGVALCSSDYEDGDMTFDSDTKTTNTVIVDPFDETGENHVLEISGEGSTVLNATFLPEGTVNDAGDDRTRIIVAEFKVNRGHRNYQRVEFCFSDSNANDNRIATNLLRVIQDGKTGAGQFAKNTWHTVKLILDQKNETFISFLDGREIKRGEITDSKQNVTLTAKFQEWDAKYAGYCYVDDFRIQTYDLDYTESFGVYQGGGEFDNLSGESATVDVAVINTSGVAEEIMNIVAVYDENDKLISATVDKDIVIPDDGVSYKIYNPSLIGANGAQGTKVKVFTWDNASALTPVDSF